MIDRYAALLALQAGPYTLAELDSMAKAKLELAWNRTAIVTAILANRLGSPPVKFEDFPYCTNLTNKKRVRQGTKAEWEAIATMLNKR